MSAAPSHFVVERLQGLLPYEAELISAIAEKLVAAWRGKLGDVRTDAASAAPQLTDLALTLHRLGGASRSEEHTSELQSLMRISYAVFCLKKKKKKKDKS